MIRERHVPTGRCQCNMGRNGRRCTRPQLPNSLFCAWCSWDECNCPCGHCEPSTTSSSEDVSSSCESVRPAQPWDVIDSTAEEICLPCEGQPAAGGSSNDGLTEGGYQAMRRVPGNWDDAELGDITTCLPDHLPEVRPEWEWVGHEQQGTYKLCVKQTSAGAGAYDATPARRHSKARGIQAKHCQPGAVHPHRPHIWV